MQDDQDHRRAWHSLSAEETCAALGDALAGKSHFSAIGGLGGADISMAQLRAAALRLAGLTAPGRADTLWLTD